MRFAQSCGNQIYIFGINAATRKGNLAWMLAHRFRPLCQDDAGAIPVCHGDEHGGIDGCFRALMLKTIAFKERHVARVAM
jgi:hypothetical protein